MSDKFHKFKGRVGAGGGRVKGSSVKVEKRVGLAKGGSELLTLVISLLVVRVVLKKQRL